MLVNGTLIRAGETVVAHTDIADRDPGVHPRPGVFDIARHDPAPALVFGLGAHACPGEALARAQFEVTLGRLATGFPGLRTAVADAGLDWKPAAPLHALRTLPLTWTADPGEG
ncbi:hypothetical protein Misp01_20530 [Microtetraspora sp. NBRC 13810]|nr:hypothetical protein Misp01_20530 [Microtetraspora sp. NBRC 13810]